LKLRVRDLKAWAVEAIRFGGKRKNQSGYIYDLDDFLRFCGKL
jgi:hypothetical protein